jgi:hypothetical protein
VLELPVMLVESDSIEFAIEFHATGELPPLAMNKPE